MTARPKSDALVSDIAKLFVLYKREDWEPILAQLRVGGLAQQQIAEAIEALASEVAVRGLRKRAVARKRPKKASPAKDILQQELTFSSERHAVLVGLETRLRTKRLLASASDLRNAYLRLGGKAVPKDRAGAVKALLLHLDNLPDDAFPAALEELRRASTSTAPDLADDYARWFALIQKSKA